MQIMGRLRQPGTCTLFTTSSDLAYIVENNRNSFAIEMASLVLATEVLELWHARYLTSLTVIQNPPMLLQGPFILSFGSMCFSDSASP